MVDVVETTIGGTTPDHDEVVDWEFDTSVDISTATGSDTIQRGLLQVLESNSVILVWNGATVDTDGTTYRELTYGGTGGARYDLIADTGSGFTSSATVAIQTFGEGFERITGILIEMTNAAADACWVLNSAEAVDEGLLVDSCVIRSTQDGEVVRGNGGSRWWNCIYISTTGSVTKFGSAEVQLHNCLQWSTGADGRGFWLQVDDSTDTELTNNIAFGHFGGFHYDFDGTSSNGLLESNMSGDGTAFGNNPQQNQTDTDVHTDPDAEDFSPKSDGNAVGNGYEHGEFTHDITGAERTGPMDIGPYDFPAGVDPATFLRQKLFVQLRM